MNKFAPFILTTLMLSMIGSINAVDFDLGTEYIGTDCGIIIFNNAFTTSTAIFEAGTASFTDFTWSGQNFGTIGFSTSVNTIMAINQVTASQVIISITATSPSTTRIITNKDPTQVIGAAYTRTGNTTTLAIPIGWSQITLNYGPVTEETTENVTNSIGRIIETVTQGNNAMILFGVLLIYIWISGQSKHKQKAMTKRIKGAFK